MSRLIATGDLHLGLKRYGRETPEGNSRVLDFAATLERFVDEAISHDCHYAALLGDNFHTRHPGPRELALFTEQVQRATREGIQVFVLPGNHDGMDTVGDAASHTLAWMRAARMPNVYVLTEPGVWTYPSDGGPGIVVASMPYPHRRALDAALQGTPDERVEETSQRVEAIIERLAAEAKDAAGYSLPKVFLGHLSVLNSKLGSEQSMRIGYDVTVRPEVFDGFDLVLLGHIHRAQMVGPKIMYVGSPDYHLFEDGAQQKAFVVAELHVPPTIPFELSRIDSGARKMVRLDIGQREDGTFNDAPVVNAALDGAMVELALYAHYERPSSAEQARLRGIALQQGASFVKIEVAASPETTTNRTAIRSEDAPEGALEAWLAAQDDIPMEPTLTVGKALIASTMSDVA